MTYEEINEMMQEIGLPYAYHHFAEGESPNPPFTLFLSPGEHTFGADDLMYISFKKLDIELYTDEKSPETEERVEETLHQHNIYFIGNESEIDVELYAMGKYDEESNTVNINWFTNYSNNVYNIQYSVDNESYHKIAEVTGSNEYSYVLSDAFEKCYFRVGLTTNYGDNIFSIPFVINNANGNITVEFIDSDDDKLPDVFELMYETDILNLDTDLDGLTDYEEVYITLTRPTKYDSIHSNISDSDVDVDNDELSNIQEIKLGTNPRLKDTDNDGLSDNDEILLFNTNPLVPDTDEDGIIDGNEITMGLDPNDPETFDVPDTEYSVNQTISFESISFSKINSKDNPYEASIDVKVADVASKAVVIKESPYTETLSNNQSIIGKVISVSYSKPVESFVLKFRIKQEYINDEINENETGLSGINKYHIFCYDENNILHPVETHITDNELTTDASMPGNYCIINLNKWLSSLDTVFNAEELNNSSESNLKTETIPPIDTTNQIQTLSYPKTTKLLSANSSGSNPSINEKRHEIDLVYVIDTSGSMSNTINTAKSSMYNLVSFLHKDGIDANIGVISYSDYIFDGVNGAKTYSINGSHWATTPTDASKSIDQVVIYGNGHETPLDGLEMAHRLDFHSQNTKFMVLITDEPYIYSENRYDILSMQDLADELKKDKIYTSVVCYNSHSNGYSPIYDTTQGIQIDLSLNWPLFLEKYISTFIKDMRTYTTLIPNSLSFISLKEVPKYGAQVNSDSDNLWDYEEIDWDYIESNESVLVLPTLKQYLLSKYGKNSLETLPLAKEKIDRINALVILPIKSDPTKADSDGDGLDDDKDVMPFHAFDNRFKVVSDIDSVPENDFVNRHLGTAQK